MPITFDTLIGELNVVAFNYETSTEKPLQGTPTYLMFNPQGQLVKYSTGPARIESLERLIQEHQ